MRHGSFSTDRGAGCAVATMPPNGARRVGAYFVMCGGFTQPSAAAAAVRAAIAASGMGGLRAVQFGIHVGIAAWSKQCITLVDDMIVEGETPAGRQDLLDPRGITERRSGRRRWCR